MLCTLKWTSALPAIIGEDKEKKFTVNVNLGSASKFLSFDEQQRTFAQIPLLNKVEKDVFTV